MMKQLLAVILLSIFSFSSLTSQNLPMAIQLKEDIEVREQPNIESPVIGLIRNSNYIEVLERVNDFYKIKHIGKISYTNYPFFKENIQDKSVSLDNDITTSKKPTSKSSSTTTSKTIISKSSHQNNSYNTPRRNSISRSRSSYSGLCGAPTKKGGSCQRRVSGGGRCWQH